MLKLVVLDEELETRRKVGEVEPGEQTEAKPQLDGDRKESSGRLVPGLRRRMCD